MKTRNAIVLAVLIGACGSKEKAPVDDAPAPKSSSTDPLSQSVSSGDAEQTPVRLPGKLTPAPWLEGATRVIAVNNAGKTLPPTIIVAAGLRWLRWFDAKGNKLGERELSGAVAVLESADVDGDGSSEVIVGSGRARGALSAPIALEVFRLDGDEPVEAIPLPSTSRAQVVAVCPAPKRSGHLWVASFVSKFEVSVLRFARDEKGQWKQAESRGIHRVVGDMTVLDGEPEFGTPVIARLYGEDADAPGGVYELLSETESTALPTIRGARALLSIPRAQDRSDLVVADGWHKHYAKKAQGLISYYWKSLQFAAAPTWQLQNRVKVQDNYGLQRMRAGDVHTNPGVEIVVSGNGPALVSLPLRPDLLFALGSMEAIDAFPVNLSGDLRQEVVIVGPSPVIWSAL